MIVLSLLMLLISSCNALYVKDAHYKAFLKSNDCVVLQFASPSNPDSNRLLDCMKRLRSMCLDALFDLWMFTRIL